MSVVGGINSSGAITGTSLTVGSTGAIICGSIQIGNTSIADPGGALATQSFVQSQGYLTSGSGVNPTFGNVNLRSGLTTTFIGTTFNVVDALGRLYDSNTLISSTYAKLAGTPVFTNGLSVTGQYGTNSTSKYFITSINSNATIYVWNSNTYAIGINSTNLIQSGTGFIINSDNRIKKNIQTLSPEESLQLIQSLKPVSFDYIDTTKRTTKKYGFIAQEVESVLPTIINYSSDYIPNIFEMVQTDKTNKTKIRLTTKTTDTFEKAQDKSQKIKLKFYDISNNEILREIQEIIDDKTILLSQPITEDLIFLYGQEVPDFRSVEHEQINTILLSAVQAQQKKIEDLEQKIDFLLSKIQ